MSNARAGYETLSQEEADPWRLISRHVRLYLAVLIEQFLLVIQSKPLGLLAAQDDPLNKIRFRKNFMELFFESLGYLLWEPKKFSLKFT